MDSQRPCQICADNFTFLKHSSFVRDLGQHIKELQRVSGVNDQGCIWIPDEGKESCVLPTPHPIAYSASGKTPNLFLQHRFG